MQLDIWAATSDVFPPYSRRTYGLFATLFSDLRAMTTHSRNDVSLAKKPGPCSPHVEQYGTFLDVLRRQWRRRRKPDDAELTSSSIPPTASRRGTRRIETGRSSPRMIPTFVLRSSDTVYTEETQRMRISALTAAETTYVAVDNAYADWYKDRFGKKKINRSHVLLTSSARSTGTPGVGKTVGGQQKKLCGWYQPRFASI